MRDQFLAHFTGYRAVLARVDSVNFDSDCWLMSGDTYPRWWRGKQYTYIHRLSLEIARGEPLGPLYACHTCDNPPCVNPEHLFAATCGDNLRDMCATGRHWTNPRRGQAHPHATVSDADVQRAIDRVHSGETRTSVAADLGVTRKALYNWLAGNSRNASGGATPC